MFQELSSDESADEEQIFRDFDAEAQLIIRKETLPKKSADRYLLVYDSYKAWDSRCKTSKTSEKNIWFLLMTRKTTNRDSLLLVNSFTIQYKNIPR